MGEKGQTCNKRSNGRQAPTTITYSSYYGCQKRIGFAIKMPPDDGQDSSTYGISQCKLKLEVYYEGDLTVKDTAGANHGIRRGALPVVTPYGMGLQFDGTDDYVKILHSDSLSITDEITIEVRIKTDQEKNMYIITKGDWGDDSGSYGLMLRESNIIRFYYCDNKYVEFVAPQSYYDNNFHHIVWTFDWSNTDVELYMDGNFVDSENALNNLAINSYDLYIGMRDDGDYQFKGIIASVRIYNRALSAEEIQALYNGERITDGLVAEWLFEDDYDFGRTTYEFENSTNQYYGLQNMNDSWIAFFDPDGNEVEFLILSQRPLGLKVRADENEEIDQVELTLKKGTVVYAGQLYHSNLSADLDGDGVPDVFEEGLG